MKTENVGIFTFECNVVIKTLNWTLRLNPIIVVRKTSASGWAGPNVVQDLVLVATLSINTWYCLSSKDKKLSYGQTKELSSVRKQDDSSWEENCGMPGSLYLFSLISCVSFPNIFSLFIFFFFFQANDLKVSSVFRRFCSLHSFEAFLRFAH